MREILFRAKRLENGEWVKNGRIAIGKYIRNDDKGNRKYECVCDCGYAYEIDLNNFRRSKGIGCVKCKNIDLKRNKTKHNESGSRLHTIWMHMITRCTAISSADYPNYGGRGITIVDEWLDYVNFRDWANKNGYDKFLTIDRVDVNGNYEPTNCRWATFKQQQNNRRNNTRYTINNQTKTISEWCDVYNIRYQVVKCRIRRGLDIEKALSLPLQKPFGIKKLTK